ncbi:MAG: hypothetical protein GF344_02765 [Chitinivibrionales bacterium]|nr:hypothetical protein [Chitinivibrionales bacterium]MBD3356005.1 hypothetical protein [Chitinivibrionales bacterium]
MNTYFTDIYRKYKWFLLGIGAVYLFAWGYSYWAGTIDGERPGVRVAFVKFVSVTFLLVLPSFIIFVDSLKRLEFAGGYVVAGLVLNIYALVAYWLKRTKEKKAEECSEKKY